MQVAWCLRIWHLDEMALCIVDGSVLLVVVVDAFARHGVVLVCGVLFVRDHGSGWLHWKAGRSGNDLDARDAKTRRSESKDVVIILFGVTLLF